MKPAQKKAPRVLRQVTMALDGNDLRKRTPAEHNAAVAALASLLLEAAGASALPAVVHGVERVVDVEHDPARHVVAEAVATVVDHGSSHAQQGPRIRQVLQARDGRLGAQVAIVRQAAHRQLDWGSKGAGGRWRGAWRRQRNSGAGRRASRGARRILPSLSSMAAVMVLRLEGLGKAVSLGGAPW